jgi:hypothetical protein
MMNEIIGGLLVSFLNFGIHAGMTGLIVVATRHAARLTDHLNMFFRLTTLLMITMVVLMCGHFGEIGLWAWFYQWAEIPIKNAGYFEFAFENYTALGYGDAVATEGRRMIGPITALNGLLLIGWSVAIIFEVMRMAELQIRRVDKSSD